MTPPRPSTAALAGAWLPLLAYLAMIFYFSSRTGSELPDYAFMRHDKLLHTGEYFWLGVLAARAARITFRWSFRRAAIAAALFCVVWGASDEFHQSFVPHRNGNDPGDLAADTVGGTLGAAALAFAGTLRARRLTRRLTKEATS